MGGKNKDKKAEESGKEDLTQEDFEDELEHREFSMFWDSLDIGESWKSLLRLFAIRLAFTLVQVHLKKHPDEIQ
jgi:hypothetical protein